jgi:carboxyl-terminal processing protease
MKIKTIGRFVLAIMLAGQLLLAQGDLVREKFLSQLLLQSLETFHYSEKKVNDDFSARGFKEYMEILDYSKRFFHQADIDELNEYSLRMDDEFKQGNMDLMVLATGLLQKRIKEVMGFYTEILSRPFDFSKQETLELDAEKRTYCRNGEELREYWRKILKYYCLINTVNLVRSGEKKAFTPELEARARQAVEKSFKSQFTRLLQASENDAPQLYFNSLVQVFDPHSNYLPPKEKEDFDIEMSGQFEGIGALLREEDGLVSVARIIPGGPSWRQRSLQPGDSILKVAQGDEEPVDIVGMRVVDAVKLIRGEKGSLVRLTVKKPDGRITEIPIVRDVVIVEESFAKAAFVRHSETGKTIGYINLPRFYRDFSRNKGRNSTDDVKTIISDFNQKGVDGVVLDLRNNSGGSLIDAIRISGLFISRGPIVQVKNREQGIRVLKDTDRKIQYDGPLVVMVNVLSASASEILAAALQDYGRAVIMGGTHSYGKATVQIMVDLDRYLANTTDPEQVKSIDKLGALKLTIQKFYRITGGSNQYQGVVPDITLPDRFDYLEIGEKYLENSLAQDSITPVSFSKWDRFNMDLKSLAAGTQRRTEQSPYFNGVKAYVKHLREARKNTCKSLHFETFFEEQQQVMSRQKEIEGLEKESPYISVNAAVSVTEPAPDAGSERSDEQLKIAAELQREWFTRLKKDSYLEEAMMVIHDMVVGFNTPPSDQ